MQREKQYSTFILRLILVLMGIAVNSDHRKYEKYRIVSYFVVFLPVIVLSQWFTIMSLDTFVYKMDAALYFGVTFFYTVMIAIVYRQRSALLLVYNNISRNEDFIDKKFFEVCDPRLKATVKSVGIILGVGALLWCTVPISVACFSDVELGSSPTLQFPAVYPWRGNTPLTYALTMCTQSVLVFVPITLYLGTVSFILYSRVLISSLVSIVTWKVDQIRNINQLTHYCGADQQCSFVECGVQNEITIEEKKLNQQILQHLYDVVRYHQFMMKMTKDCIYLITPYINLSILIFIMNSIFMTTTVILVDGNYMYRLKMFNSMFVSWCNLMISSLVGDSLNEMNDQVIACLYKMEWQEHSIQFRKEMLRFMIICQRPFMIKMFKISVVNYAYITTLLRCTYSVVQVILRIQK